jgi:hypothetical protein
VLSAEQIQEAFEEQDALFGQEEDDVLHAADHPLGLALSGPARRRTPLLCGRRGTRDCAACCLAARTALRRRRHPWANHPATVGRKPGQSNTSL